MPMLTTLTLAQTMRHLREQPGSTRRATGPGAVPRDAVHGELHERIRYAANHSAAQTLERMGTRPSGLTVSEAAAARDLYGENVIAPNSAPRPLHRLARAFANPFNAILAATALILLYTNLAAVAPGRRDLISPLLIAAMIVVSGLLRLLTERRGDAAAACLRSMVPTTCTVTRNGRKLRLPVSELVPGDILDLDPGEIVPADARVLTTRNLLVDESLLTGESAPVEKLAESPTLGPSRAGRPNGCPEAIAFAGTSVHAGHGTAVVLAIGQDTYLGQMGRVLSTRPTTTSCDEGIASTARTLLLFMLVMVLAVFLLRLATERDAASTLLFSAAIVAGITPQLLPAIASACLARGALALSKRQVVVKSLDVLQNLSAMDVLCCDKTGTLVKRVDGRDEPREGALDATAALGAHGVDIKVLTGDNRRAAVAACHEMGIGPRTLMLGPEVDQLTDAQLAARAESARIFAEVTPLQKARIARVLREMGGHTVGFAGDGINDAPALRVSDCGIAPGDAADVAREAADLVLVRNNLEAVDRAVLEGRKAYGNLVKYLKIAASSNFGNVLSVLVACMVLPFLPMTALQIIVLSLAYTAACAALPWDRMDRGYLESPRMWQPRELVRFMLHMGPVSSLFDIATFAFLLFALCPTLAGGGWSALAAAGDAAGMARFIMTFQTGWFVTSLWTQALVLHALRTGGRPLAGGRCSRGLAVTTIAVLAACTALPFSPWAHALGLCPLPAAFFGWLLVVVAGYLMAAGIAKARYQRRYGELL